MTIFNESLKDALQALSDRVGAKQDKDQTAFQPNQQPLQSNCIGSSEEEKLAAQVVGSSTSPWLSTHSRRQHLGYHIPQDQDVPQPANDSSNSAHELEKK